MNRLNSSSRALSPELYGVFARLARAAGILLVIAAGFPTAASAQITGAQLQTDINSACNGTQPGELIVSPGQTITIDTSITIPSYCVLDGGNSVLKAKNALDSPVLKVMSKSYVTIRNAVLDGNAANQTSTNSPETAALYLDESTAVTIEDVTAQNTLQDCFALFNANSTTMADDTAQNCGYTATKMSDGGNGLFVTATVASSDLIVSSFRVLTTAGENCVYVSGKGFFSKISMSNINGTGCADEGVEIDGSSLVTLANVSVQHASGSTGDGVLVLADGATHDYAISGVTCDNSFAICVDVADWHSTETGISNVSVSGVIANGTGSSGDLGFGAVRISNGGPTGTVFQNFSFSQIMANGTYNGFYCVAAPNNEVNYISLSSSVLEATNDAYNVGTSATPANGKCTEAFGTGVVTVAGTKVGTLVAGNQ